MQEVVRIKKYLEKLDISPEITDVYLELTKLGPATALQLTRKTGKKRTQIYRHLEELQDKGLLSQEKLSYGTLFRALPIDNIEGLIADREAENAALRRGLGSMSDAIKAMIGAEAPETKVHHYYGKAGLKQVNWNLTKATKEFRVFEQAHLSQHLDQAFARRCRERYMEKGLVSYDLTNAIEVHSKALQPYNPKNSHVRHVDRKVLNIDFEIYMYDNIVTFLDYKNDQPHATEIEHPALAQMMKQLFDAIWHTATPLEITK